MESLTRAQFETVADKLLVFGIYRSLADFVASVSLVIENRVTYTRHMYANLVRTSGLKLAFHISYKAETLQDTIMRDRPLALVLLLKTLNLIRSLGSLPILPSIVPSSSLISPQTIAT